MEQRKPRKPVSAYSLYFRDTVKAINAKNPMFSLQTLTRVVASMWEFLDPDQKEVYLKKAAEQEEASKASPADGGVEQQTMAQQVDNNQAGNTITINTNQTEPPKATQSDLLLAVSAKDDAVQMCRRRNCKKRAIENPEWEDEYCSDECVVKHCREEFNYWLHSSLDS